MESGSAVRVQGKPSMILQALLLLPVAGIERIPVPINSGFEAIGWYLDFLKGIGKERDIPNTDMKSYH